MFLEKLQGGRLTVAITIACGSGFLLFGYSLSVFGGIITQISFLERFGNPNATIKGQIVSSFDLGCVLGAILSIFVGDKLGRRGCALLGCCFFILGGALQAASYWLPMLIIGLIIAGIGNGINTAQIPIWQSETSKASRRGVLICIQLVCVVSGIVIAECVNFGFSYVGDSSVAWRFPLACECFFALLTIGLTTTLALPESPRWLASMDRTSEAHAVIARLTGKPASHPDVLAETESIRSAVEQETSRPSVREFFAGGKSQTFRRLCLGAGPSIFQQLGGVNVIVCYLPILFTQSFGFKTRLSLILSIVDSINLLIWGVFASFLVERVGRKKMMLQGAIGQAICFACAAAGLGVGNKAGNSAAVFFIFLYYMFYGTGLMATPFIYAAEINSQRMRTVGTAVAMIAQWLGVYLVVVVTPVGVANIGWRFYIVFAVLNVAFIPFIIYFYVETAGLSLEEVDRVFELKYGRDDGVKISYDEAIAEVNLERRIRTSENAKEGLENLEKAELEIEEAVVKS